MRRWVPGLLLSVVVLTACGGTGAPVRSSLSVRQALTSSPEALEFESPATRQELFRELARLSEQEEGQAAQALVLFPISHHGELVAAPGFGSRMDLLQAPDAGGVLQLTFDGRTGEHWPDDRRDSLQGLSEREAAELVARTLLTHWGIQQTGPVQVDRVSGAPYAVAYVDGILRINPAFLYLAAATGPASTAASVQ
ncbi:hypothetical protein [Hyalangium versicolor]|uniref:hypothetical protein n=1 Tax=Hyalangium versicolor TaxID=2861190 RepID=UPI001CCE6E87|nr:hypothetical protein [Hyalangium versicolor]